MIQKYLSIALLALMVAACATTGDPAEENDKTKRGAAIGAAAGAVAGAVIGNAVERSATREEAVEILVQLRNGERRAIVQAKGAETLNPGDQVIIVTTGGKARVVKAPRS
jgi:outer membrane lipoprotein SlyB